jgi:hypothetical protein
MRAQEFLAENKQATAKQVLAYINQTHHEPMTAKLTMAVQAHPRWELRQVPLQNLYIPDQDYEDPEQEPPRDPYDRVMAIDPDHANEYSTQIIDQRPIVVDDQGYIIDGNHRAWAAAELLNRDSIQAWVPVTQDMAEGQHQHTEIIKWPVGDWIVYLDNHSVIRAMTRNIGPRMMSNLLNMVSTIPNLEDKVPKNGAFWIQDIKTNSSFYFRRLDIPGEPLAVRCETGVQDVPRANKNTPVFRVNAYTGPETPKDIQGMKQAKLRSKFVGTNVMASNLAANIQKGHLGSDDVIRNPATQDSKRYDRAFKQAQQMDKEVDENFADGKVKGKSRPGRVKRAGASCNGSVTDLRARAKRASGEKARMYHWCANMKSGKKK